MQEKLEKTLASLVAIPSESRNRGACHQIIEFVRSELEPLGLYIFTDMERDHPYLIATTQDTRSPQYALVAHLDVVPAHPSQYTVTTVEDRLLGRGVFDMKFAASCFIELIKEHATRLKEKNIGLIFTTDEELGGHSTKDILDSGWRPGVVFIPDGGMGWNIEERAKGFTLVELTTNGKTAHASRPAQGENAIYPLIEFLIELRKRFPLKLASDPTLAVTTITAGEAWNQVPDTASATIDFRSFDDDTTKELLAYIANEGPKAGIDHTVRVRSFPLILQRDHPEVVKFVEIMASTFEQPVTFSESFGGTDGQWYARYDIPSIILQPNGGGHHSPNEWLHRTDLEKYYRLVEAWLVN